MSSLTTSITVISRRRPSRSTSKSSEAHDPAAGGRGRGQMVPGRAGEAGERLQACSRRGPRSAHRPKQVTRRSRRHLRGRPFERPRRLPPSSDAVGCGLDQRSWRSPRISCRSPRVALAQTSRCNLHRPVALPMQDRPARRSDEKAERRNAGEKSLPRPRQAGGRRKPAPPGRAHAVMALELAAGRAVARHAGLFRTSATRRSASCRTC